MSITLNPPVAVAAHKREGESAPPVPDFLPAHAANILYKDKTMKDALDELFTAFGGTASGETTVTENPAPTAHRKEDGTTLTPLELMVDASLIPYTNEEAGLAEGSTVADALDALYARLAERKENA